MTARRYCCITASAIAGALALLAAINLLVDPSRAFPIIHLQSFDRFRDTLFSRVSRAELARIGRWNMVILGTSRPKAGMPAEHAAFQSNQVCNLAVDAAHMSEVEMMFAYARRHNRLKRVLICLDLALMRQPAAIQTDFEDSRFSTNFSIVPYACDNLIGAGVTDLSIKFLARRAAGNFPPAGQRDGFHVRSLPPEMRQRALFERTLRSLAGPYAVMQPTAREMQSLREVLAACRNERIDLILAINPVHALDLELLRAAGGWERFESWKRDVAQMIHDEKMEQRAALWDFSGYWPPTCEEVPPSGDSHTRMRFYFENSHYTPAMGALMLDRIYCGATNNFGRILTLDTIEQHLALLRTQRDQYAASHSSDVAWVQRLTKQVLAARNLTGAAPDVE